MKTDFIIKEETSEAEGIVRSNNATTILLSLGDLLKTFYLSESEKETKRHSFEHEAILKDKDIELKKLELELARINLPIKENPY